MHPGHLRSRSVSLAGILLGCLAADSATAAAQSPAAAAHTALNTPVNAPVNARQLLEAEHARGADVSVLMAGTRSAIPALQRRAVRALGRFERVALRDSVLPLLTAADAAVRRETVNALGQLNAPFGYAALLTTEKNAAVRAIVYETLGRVTPITPGAESALAAGLAEPDSLVRLGAARGLESLIRKQGRGGTLTTASITSLRKALRDNRGEAFRELALLALTAAGDRDSSTLAIALRDPHDQVRRLAVIASRQWIDDASPMVHYQALRVAGTCERAAVAMRARSEMVMLAAIDVLGEKSCANAASLALLDTALADGTTWRVRAHAIVAMAKVSPTRASKALPSVVQSRTWQERSYAAVAAKLLKDSVQLDLLARDLAPNVAIAAMRNSDDAMRALSSGHAGLLVAAAAQLKGAPELKQLAPQILSTIQRLTATKQSTYRDPIVALTQRLRETGDPINIPSVADFPVEPLPPDSLLQALEGATVRIRMRGLGTITLELLTDDAPLAVATFVQLADAGKFTGLTYHRIVPNFVVQGGSPGADEYDGISAGFMRDEVGMARNARGTLGISTRGRDTGDGQIYFNTVDNFRLDHDYTVFARVISGMDIVDRIQEGDGMQAVEVVRRKK
jgi:cyclophilin family peptidyl-prolyl cis-trans isomerase